MMNKANFIILGILIGIALIFSWSQGYFGGKAAEGVSIEISPDGFNLGQVSMAEGVVGRTFNIKNSGTGDLVISDIVTSCMCTSARLVIGDNISPVFGMHSSYSSWLQKIIPGQQAELQVRFDPNAHGPQGTGPFTRLIKMTTNAGEKTVKIRGIVTE